MANIVEAQGKRVLVVAEARGALAQLNVLAKEHKADFVIHTGSFGFFDGESTGRMSARTLRHAAAFCPLVSGGSNLPQAEEELRDYVGSQLSELPLFLAGERQFDVPVYAVWGSTEDVAVLDKFRDGTYSVPNLILVDEQTAPLLPETSIRLLGLGGSFSLPRLFDIGDGSGSIAGSAGATWTSIWQIGELIRTARRSFNASEIRLFVSHSAVSHHPVIQLLALLLRSNLTVSGELHYRYAASFSDYIVDASHSAWDHKLSEARSQVTSLWKQVAPHVLRFCEENPEQRQLITSTIEALSAPPRGAALLYNQACHKVLWHFVLPDSQLGGVLLDVKGLTVASSTWSSGFDFARPATPLADAADEPRESRETPRGPRTKERNSKNIKDRKDITSRIRDGKDHKGHKEFREPKEPRELKEPREPKEKKQERPGLWFREGNRTKDELLSLLDPEDRANHKDVVFKESGQGKQHALVYFDTVEQTAKAYERVDKTAAGTVSIATSRPTFHRRIKKP